MPYQFDKVLVNPELSDIEDLLAIAEGYANGAAHTRLVSVRSINLQKVWHEPEGTEWTDGGGVANSYRQMATTSVLGVAWYTDEAGNKHVRVIGSREGAPKSAYGRRGPKWFGLTDTEYNLASCAVLVYPILRVSHPAKKDKGLVPELLRALEQNPFDRASWMALGDYLVDLGPNHQMVPTYGMSADACRTALNVLDRLVPVAV